MKHAIGLVSASSLLCLVALTPDALAQKKSGGAAADKSGTVINLSNPRRSKYPIAIPESTDGDSGIRREVAQVASFDMSIAGWSKVLDPKSFIADLNKEALGIEVDKWKDVGAFAVMKYRVSGSGGRVSIDFRLYEVEKGDQPVLQKTYRGDSKDVRKMTHRWCNDMVKHLTGEPGYFGSKIAFTSRQRSKGGKPWSKVMAMDFDGHGAYGVTNDQSINIFPTWSRDGGKIAFTSYRKGNPDLYTVSSGGGTPKLVSSRKGMNIAGSFSPDGSKIAVTLSKDGNSDIFVVSASDGRVITRITDDRAIDTSPAWSPDGGEIAFVSDREGGPQIFIASAGGGGARRVSHVGSYNTTPCWSPAKGKKIIAYTTRGENNQFDVVTQDLDSGAMVRITQNSGGNNEEPSFAPNGHAIAFARSGGGSGIYIANADGTGDAVQVYKGAATSLDWGPAPND